MPAFCPPRNQLLAISDDLYEKLRKIDDYDHVAARALSCARNEENLNLLATWLLKPARISLRRENQEEMERLFEEAAALLPNALKSSPENKSCLGRILNLKYIS